MVLVLQLPNKLRKAAQGSWCKTQQLKTSGLPEVRHSNRPDGLMVRSEGSLRRKHVIGEAGAAKASVSECL